MLFQTCKTFHLFIFGTQIKIFFDEIWEILNLHRQQGNYHVQGPET